MLNAKSTIFEDISKSIKYQTIKFKVFSPYNVLMHAYAVIWFGDNENVIMFSL